jgi:broad specificity phosphatase PhoE
MKIYIVRHGEREKEGENPNLTKNGILQAKYLAKNLKNIKFNEFYCSELNRSKQTAEIVSKIIKMRPKVKSFLNEYESSDLKKAKSKWKAEERKRHSSLISFIDKITKKPSKERNILIIAHGMTNRFILAHLFKIPFPKMIVFKQDETCINFIYWYDKFKNWHLKKMNDNSHVPKNLLTK